MKGLRKRVHPDLTLHRIRFALGLLIPTWSIINFRVDLPFTSRLYHSRDQRTRQGLKASAQSFLTRQTVLHDIGQPTSKRYYLLLTYPIHSIYLKWTIRSLDLLALIIQIRLPSGISFKRHTRRNQPLLIARALIWISLIITESKSARENVQSFHASQFSSPIWRATTNQL